MNSTVPMDLNSAISPLGSLDAQYLYAHASHSYAETSTSSETTSPVMASFDLSIVSPDFHPMPTGIYPSPISSRETASPQPAIKMEEAHVDSLLGPTSDPSSKVSKPTPKRKRENRYKNAPPSVLSRRRAQNRASQRAYRERKDQRIRDLEAMLEEYKHKHDALSQAYSALHVELVNIRNGHPGLPSQADMSMAIPFSPTSVCPQTPTVAEMHAIDGWQYFPAMAGYPA
ncbi:hypothetical protein jhhlp_006179 [Lomentospora prolificans]|uniref:Putative transcription factor kapC n=1 Tax=Lomentospora prolificans TaxID=41688 RepID=A0A2N3N572_9PEZI|nr:hypothetical protein jhhlp_006179 [Lomentospora prolificans]